MKTTIIAFSALAIMAMAMPVGGQTYQVAVSQRPYEDLVGGQSLVNGAWADPEFAVPLGFSFPLFNETIETLYAADFYGGGYVSSNLNFSGTSLILMFTAYVIDRGFAFDSAISPITYKTTGGPGERVFTLEFKNAGFGFGDSEDGVYTEYINYQLTLHEATGDIEMHIGPYAVDNPALVFEGNAGPGIGLVEGFDFNNGVVNGELCLLDGNPNSPDIITTYVPAALNWPIPVNTVYRFYREEPSRVNDLKVDYAVNYYTPNPASGNIRLQSQWEGKIVGLVTVMNASGMIVAKDTDAEVIEMDGMPAGIYQLYFETPEGFSGQRILLLEH